MRRTFAITVAALLTLGLLAGAALAQGQGQGHGPPPFDAAEVSVLSTNEGASSRDNPSPGYSNDDNIVDTLELAEGEWKVTATGAVQVAASPEAPNCGLRLDEGGESTMIGKQNFADGSFVGRSGFAVTGHAVVDEDAEVHLVCYGTGGNDPFEYDLVAIGG